MRITRTWLFAFLPFLYLAIILGLVAFQFSKKSDSFSQSLGGLTVSGKSSTAGQPAELILRGEGLEFYFDATHFLQADSADGSSARLRPLTWSWKDGNLVVSFQKGVQLAFEKAGTGGRALLIRPVVTGTSPSFTAFHIPFGAENGVRLTRSDRGSFLQISRDKTQLLASVDGARDRIEADSTFVLTAGKNGFRPARIDPLAPGMSPDLAWMTLDRPVSPETAEAALTQYWNKAYGAWAASTAFSTALARAWGQEALLRGEYPSAFNKILTLLDRGRTAWGFEAAGFLGNVVELTAQERRSVETASSRSQPDWTDQGRLWLDARFYGPSGSADRVKNLLLTGKLPESAPELVAVFRNLQTLQSHQPSAAVTARIEEVQASLLAKVVRREGELFVRAGDGILDLKSGLLLGRLWMDFSRNLTSETFGEAGAQLVASALAYQDGAGRLPQFLVLQEGQTIRQEGSVLPEEIYALVRPEPVPEIEVPGLGPSAFLRTPAKLVSQSVTETQARFTFRFPAGSAEHIILSGVPEFDHVTMHGIRWRTDPQFQSYTDGWAYSASTKTLYVKIKHREDLEELIIHLRPEQ